MYSFFVSVVVVAAAALTCSTVVAALGLQHLHALSIFHCDIRMPNIIILRNALFNGEADEAQVACVGDLGLARIEPGYIKSSTNEYICVVICVVSSYHLCCFILSSVLFHLIICVVSSVSYHLICRVI